MTAKPPLPDDYELPQRVNGWTHDPDSSKNAHVWCGDDGRVALGVFAAVGQAEMRVKVMDERVYGLGRSQTVARVSDEEQDGTEGHIEATGMATAAAVGKAVDWMRRHDAAGWSNPRVSESIFDPPVGYTLSHAYIEERDTTLYYLRDGLDPADYGWRRGADALADVEPEAVSPADAPYLYLHVWAGSGTATVALAPFLGAHGPGSKHWEIVPVLDPPEECGLEVALKLAREWVREQTGGERETPAVGQADLSAF